MHQMYGPAEADEYGHFWVPSMKLRQLRTFMDPYRPTLRLQQLWTRVERDKNGDILTQWRDVPFDEPEDDVLIDYSTIKAIRDNNGQEEAQGRRPQGEASA